MNVPLANLPAQYAGLKTELDSAVLSALESGAFVLGTTASANAVVERLENDVAAFCGANYGIGRQFGHGRPFAFPDGFGCGAGR